MKKRILSLLGVIAILATMLLLGACKPKTDGDGDGDISGADKFTGEIKFYAWGESEISESERAQNDWVKENYGITKRYIKIAYGQMDMKYVLDISADNAPEQLYLTDERFPRYIVKGLGQPLEKYSDYVNTDNEYWAKVLANNPFKWKGQTYGITTGIQPYWLWYNKTMFEENDVKTPIEYYKEGQWNFDALATCADALTADTDGDGVVDRYGFMAWKQEALIYANGGKFFEFTDDGNIRVALEDQATINALQYIQDGGFKNDWFCYNAIDWNSGFIAERLAMTLETTWFRNSPAANVKFEVDFVPMPIGPDNTTGSTLGFATSAGLCTGAKNPYAYLKWYEVVNTAYADYLKQNNIQGSYDHLYTEEQRERLEAGKDMKWEAGFLYGVGDMAGLMNNLFYAILDGTPVATAVAQQLDTFQHEVDVTLEDNQMPTVLPFNPPPRLDFESDDYLNHIVFEEASTGELFGIEQPTLTTDPNEAIDGTSLKFTIYPEEAFQMFYFKDTYTFPAYHTYTISFDYKMLEDMDDDGRFLITICPKNSTVGGPHKASVGLTNLMAGDSGTFTMDVDVYEYGDPAEYTLAFVGVNAGSIVIDNVQVKDVSAN